MRKIILKSRIALGDIVCLTAVPREMHRAYPGQFQIAVDTPFADLWANNPHIVGHCDYASEWENWQDWELIECRYDRDLIYSVNKSNQHQCHLITSYCRDVANSLGLPSLYPDRLAGDIHLGRAEWGLKSPPHELHNCQRYWVICAGGKTDFTVKHWLPEHFQQVVNYFKGRIQFVQVGQLGAGHVHPQLQGVINLVGQTDVRQLIQLVHSSCGVLSGITSVTHLAAAVPVPTWQKRHRPCVVVAGGREPRSWYGYPTHRILETIGSLSCCATGGCWHARTVPLNDGHDDRLCERVVHGHPKCMTMIRPEQVILAIEQYLESEGIE